MRMKSRSSSARPSETEVTVVSDVNVVGILAQFGRGMIQDVSDQMFEKFRARCARELEAPRRPAAPAGDGDAAGRVRSATPTAARRRPSRPHRRRRVAPARRPSSAAAAGRVGDAAASRASAARCIALLGTGSCDDVATVTAVRLSSGSSKAYCCDGEGALDDPRAVRLSRTRARCPRRWRCSSSTATRPRSSPAARACCRCSSSGWARPATWSTSAASPGSTTSRKKAAVLKIGGRTRESALERSDLDPHEVSRSSPTPRR